MIQLTYVMIQVKESSELLFSIYLYLSLPHTFPFYLREKKQSTWNSPRWDSSILKSYAFKPIGMLSMMIRGLSKCMVLELVCSTFNWNWKSFHIKPSDYWTFWLFEWQLAVLIPHLCSWNLKSPKRSIQKEIQIFAGSKNESYLLRCIFAIRSRHFKKIDQNLHQ